MKKHVQHLQLLPARAKPTSKVNKPYQMCCIYLFPQVLHKDLKVVSTYKILGQIEHLQHNS